MKVLMLVLAAALAAAGLWALLRHEAFVKEVEAERRQLPPPAVVQRQTPQARLKSIVERYEDGTRKAISQVRENDPKIREGVSSEYYRNGKLRAETSYTANVPNGRFTLYYEDGGLLLEGTLKNGLRDGRFTEWHPSGRVKIECGYRNGLLDGAWNEYYEADGSPKKVEASYSAGAPSGRYAIYKLDGLVKEERFFGLGQAGQSVSLTPQQAASRASEQAQQPLQQHDCSDAPLPSNSLAPAPKKPQPSMTQP